MRDGSERVLARPGPQNEASASDYTGATHRPERDAQTSTTLKWADRTYELRQSRRRACGRSGGAVDSHGRAAGAGPRAGAGDRRWDRAWPRGAGPGEIRPGGTAGVDDRAGVPALPRWSRDRR